MPFGFIGTIEDDEEIKNDDIDSEEDEVSLCRYKIDVEVSLSLPDSQQARNRVQEILYIQGWF